VHLSATSRRWTKQIIEAMTGIETIGGEPVGQCPREENCGKAERLGFNKTDRGHFAAKG
jgi:hypothetical protein